MNKKNVKRIKWQMPREKPTLACESCAEEAAYLRNVGEDLNVEKEIWVPRCEICKDVEMRAA